MSGENFRRRLDRLQTIYSANACTNCRGVSLTRIVCLNDDGSFEDETLPEFCPECGASVMQTLELVGFRVEDLP